MTTSPYQRFLLSPLIRGTLLSVYLALVLPLPFLAPPALKPMLSIAAPLGLALVVAMLSEQVLLDENGVCRYHDDTIARVKDSRMNFQWC